MITWKCVRALTSNVWSNLQRQWFKCLGQSIWDHPILRTLTSFLEMREHMSFKVWLAHLITCTGGEKIAPGDDIDNSKAMWRMAPSLLNSWFIRRHRSCMHILGCVDLAVSSICSTNHHSLHGSQWGSPSMEFQANYHTYNMFYYLEDEIYPKCKTFEKPIPSPKGKKQLQLHNAQLASRKNVERAFGILQAQFAIGWGPTRF